MDQTTLDYQSLRNVLEAAYKQASEGKGKDRHAQDLPFEEQPMHTISNLLGTHDGLLYQAIKKCQESKRMKTAPAIAELLGAIVYISGAVIQLQQKQAKEEAEPTVTLRKKVIPEAIKPKRPQLDREQLLELFYATNSPYVSKYLTTDLSSLERRLMATGEPTACGTCDACVEEKARLKASNDAALTRAKEAVLRKEAAEREAAEQAEKERQLGQRKAGVTKAFAEAILANFEKMEARRKEHLEASKAEDRKRVEALVAQGVAIPVEGFGYVQLSRVKGTAGDE